MQETASGGEDNQQQRRKTANTTIEIGGREQRTWRVGEGAFRKKKKKRRGAGCISALMLPVVGASR